MTTPENLVVLTAEERQAMRENVRALPAASPAAFLAEDVLRALDSDEAREQQATGQYDENVSLIAKLATAERDRDEAQAALARAGMCDYTEDGQCVSRAQEPTT